MPFISSEDTQVALHDDKLEFWMVWSPTGGPPTVRHPSERCAELEAERLAALRPGRRFYILHATGYRCVDTMQRVTLEPANDIPF